MKKDPNVHSTVQVKSSVLKKDRNDAGYTQSAFSAACRSVSLSTVRRAEQGFRVTESAVHRMASVLNMPFERYIAEPQSDARVDYVAWLAGDWTCVYVKAENSQTPLVITQAISIRQNGDHIEGEVADTSRGGIFPEISFSGKVANNVATGSTNVKVATTTAGLGTFCQIAKRHNSWLEGPFSWFDQDAERIQTSQLIAVRCGSPNYDRYIKEAGIVIERELSVYRIRALMEAGYMLDDAVTMLAALRAGI